MNATFAAIAVTHAVAHAVLPGTQPPLPGLEAAVIGLVAFAIVMLPPLLLSEHFTVMPHEGAHTLVGTALGFGLEGVFITSKAKGETRFTDATMGLRWLLAANAGYLGPSLFGLGAAKLIETRHVIAVLWIAIFLLVLLLFLVRDAFGRVSVPVAIALIAVVMRYAHTGTEEIFTYLLTWLLLLSGVRVAARHGAGASDAQKLGKATGVPAQLWAWLWLAGTLLAVVIGGKWLVMGS
jgi:hypothetical protein